MSLRKINTAQSFELCNLGLEYKLYFVLHLYKPSNILSKLWNICFCLTSVVPCSLCIFHVSAQFDKNRHNMLCFLSSNTIVCQHALRPSFQFLLIIFTIGYLHVMPPSLYWWYVLCGCTFIKFISIWSVLNRNLN